MNPQAQLLVVEEALSRAIDPNPEWTQVESADGQRFPVHTGRRYRYEDSMKRGNLQHLHLQTKRLCTQWSMFDELYEQSENYPVFERTGEKFWGELKALLLDSIMLGISRLLESAQNRHQENLSLRGFLDLAVDDVARTRWEADIEAMEKLWKPGVKVWRDKRISHGDLEFVTGLRNLPDVPFADIKKLVMMIASFVSRITLEDQGFEVGFVPPVTHWVPTVLQYLKLGIQKKDEKLNVLRSLTRAGNGSGDDIGDE